MYFRMPRPFGGPCASQHTPDGTLKRASVVVGEFVDGIALASKALGAEYCPGPRDESYVSARHQPRRIAPPGLVRARVRLVACSIAAAG